MNKSNSHQDKSDYQGNLNKITVLQLIRNKKEITRAEIIKISGLSAPTITRIIESLVQMNLIQTDGVGSSIGGRRPQLIHFNSKTNFVIGIDLGATFIRSALSNLDGEFIFEIQIPTNIKDGFSGVMEQVGSLIEKLSIRATQNNLRLCGIGIAVCGMVNKRTGIVEYSPIFNWRNVNIKEALLKYTSLNIVLGNVVQLIAKGELLYGVGKIYNNFICLNLGYGIGSGIISDGKLFSGSDGIAGEIGHVIVAPNSNRKGLEGIHGTLEAVASGYGIAGIAKERVKDRTDSILHDLNIDDIDAKKVFEAAKHNDELALEIVNTVAHSYCIGIDTLIKLFNTECIVLSGGLVQKDNLLIDKINENIGAYSMSAIAKTIPIIKTEFGENSALMGSFSLILEKILQLDPSSF